MWARITRAEYLFLALLVGLSRTHESARDATVEGVNPASLQWLSLPMTHKGSQVVVRESPCVVSYHCFAVLTLTHGLRDLHARLMRAVGELPPSEYRIERQRMDDKFVVWAWIRDDEASTSIRTHLMGQAALYAHQNGCIYLPICEVCERHGPLYWEIVNTLPHAEFGDGTDDSHEVI